MRLLAARVLPLALVLFALTPARASARLLLITYVERTSQVGAVTSAAARQKLVRKAGAGTPSVGFRYHAVGVFWLDVWTWGGHFYVAGGKDGVPLTDAEAAEALGVTEGDLARPVFYRYPLGLLILCGAATTLVPMALSRWRAEAKVRRLLQDERYRTARRLLAGHAARQAAALAAWDEAARLAEEEGREPPPPLLLPEEDDGWDEAVAYLAGAGVAPEEAEKNLTAVLTYLDNRPRLKV
jgi:hypothetical protein